jgi:hypothetical protein
MGGNSPVGPQKLSQTLSARGETRRGAKGAKIRLHAKSCTAEYLARLGNRSRIKDRNYLRLWNGLQYKVDRIKKELRLKEELK